MKYNTQHKKEVLELIKSYHGEHFSVEELYVNANVQKIKISLTTLYRLINELVEENILKKFYVDFTHNACYREANCENTDDHLHMICTKCNKLMHIESKDLINDFKNIEKDENIEIDMSKIVLYGVCDECKEKH